jgi:hypothetical protein
MAFESMEGRYCVSSRDKIGVDHPRFSAKYMAMPLCRVELCGFQRGFGRDLIDVG